MKIQDKSIKLRVKAYWGNTKIYHLSDTIHRSLIRRNIFISIIRSLIFQISDTMQISVIFNINFRAFEEAGLLFIAVGGMSYDDVRDVEARKKGSNEFAFPH